MSIKVNVQPELLRWARERARLAADELARRMNLKVERVTEWERTGELSFAHLEKVAAKTHTPLGYLFLPAPPGELLPIADFRRQHAGERYSPSPDLLDTIYLCQQRQAWYRDHVVTEGEDRVPFVGTAEVTSPPETVAARIRVTIGLEPSNQSASTWEDALRQLLGQIEASGVLVMRNGIVGNDTHRKLDVGEFRGFALCDEYAPLIFVNAADSQSAQMFTLAHELVHLWLGQSGVSDTDPNSPDPTERFCNATAADVLVPMKEFRRRWQTGVDVLAQSRSLSREFKVSPMVVIIRAAEAGMLTRMQAEELLATERNRVAEAAKPSGGDFYRTQRSRLGRRFAAAVIASALEGRTTYTTAFRLLGLRSGTSFDQLARSLGVTH